MVGSGKQVRAMKSIHEDKIEDIVNWVKGGSGYTLTLEQIEDFKAGREIRIEKNDYVHLITLNLDTYEVVFSSPEQKEVEEMLSTFSPTPSQVADMQSGKEVEVELPDGRVWILSLSDPATGRYIARIPDMDYYADEE